jgi:hemoglobin-like flavoprotein
MDADKKAQIQAHAQAIAALLYEETDPEQVKTLVGIEQVVRKHMLEHVSPEVGNFLLQQVAARPADANAASIALLDN